MSGYWERPIPVQNPPLPPFLGTDFKSVPMGQGGFPLYPDACGQCHKDQYNGWKDSLHSKAVGPGLLGQLPGTDLKSVPKDPEFALSCYFCHAPMEEQAEVKKQTPDTRHQTPDRNNNYTKNLFFDNRLKLSGVSCSVCHLRKGKVYGPPKRQGVRGQGSGVRDYKSEIRPRSGGAKSEIEAHDGFIEKDFFGKAEFCAACHQLDEGYELNGKPLTNTYREWKESFYSKNNIHCQSCHMPDRRHLFRGIHDPDMVKKGIAIDVSREGNKARLAITNTGVGHFFPTYTTPMVVIKGFLVDMKGKIIPGSLKEAFIGRKVSLDLTQEFFDTRVPPQKGFEFDYNPPIPPLWGQISNLSAVPTAQAGLSPMGKGGFSNKLVFEVWVYPDEFYNRFYKSLLKGNEGFNRKAIEKALKITEGSGYRLFRRVL
ncbi:MAG: hypothetical protein HY878_06585 [Deltaproteobacteria bacterium]|nr:hypothetical protein [Deltaproteobacteria bacterium]